MLITKRMNQNGFMEVLSKIDEKGNPRYVLEHIRVAENKIQRPLKPNESVVWLNGNQTDNRPENIDVVSKKIGFLKKLFGY